MTAEQLRNSILQEAISGRLVPQDPNDEPASVLLQRIREEKARLVKEGAIKAKEVLEYTIDDIPYELPDNWSWVKLGEISYPIKRGKSPVYVENSQYIAFAQKCNTKKGYIDLGLAKYIESKKAETQADIYLKLGDIVINSTGTGTLGRVGLFNVEYPENIIGVVPDSHVATVRLLSIYPEYAYYFLRTCQAYLESLGEGGTNQKELKPSSIAELLFPLPPLAEQKRIVAKLEELLPIVEQYGKAQKELDELNAALPARLRQSILQEAIQGKLVPQNENEGTAEELLKLIDAEKQRLVKERILKKAIRTSAIIPEDSPFEIPTSWLWANLEDVTYAVGGRENQILSKEILKEGKIRVVSQGQAIYDGYCNDATKEINDLPIILFGDHTRNVKYIDFPFVIGADGTKLFRPIGIYPRYLYYWMKYAASTLRNRGYARHYTLLKVVPVPLPPLAEQQRIVSKIEELFEQIDKISK